MANTGLPDEAGRIGGQVATPRDKAKALVKSFERTARFDSYVRSGMPPENAAYMLGIKLPVGRYLHPTEIRKYRDQKNS